jgi:hypothetical protein
MFWRARRVGKRLHGTKALHLALLMGLVIGSACLPDPQQMQMRRLLDELVEARAALSEQPPRMDVACDTVGDVASRLSGEPGLVDVRSAWPALNAAAEALQAVCGQDRLLEQPFEPTAAMLAARARWQQGVAHELAASCAHLNEAARALGRAESCAG